MAAVPRQCAFPRKSVDKKQLEHFREQLLKNRRLLLDALNANETATETVELDQTRQGRLSRMDALQGQAMSIAALNRRKIEVKKIEGALKLIDSEDFGFCVQCGAQISFQRLEVNPTVTLCIHCAEKLESKN